MGNSSVNTVTQVRKVISVTTTFKNNKINLGFVMLSKSISSHACNSRFGMHSITVTHCLYLLHSFHNLLYTNISFSVESHQTIHYS